MVGTVNKVADDSLIIFTFQDVIAAHAKLDHYDIVFDFKHSKNLNSTSSESETLTMINT